MQRRHRSAAIANCCAPAGGALAALVPTASSQNPAGRAGATGPGRAWRNRCGRTAATGSRGGSRPAAVPRVTRQRTVRAGGLLKHAASSCLRRSGAREKPHGGCRTMAGRGSQRVGPACARHVSCPTWKRRRHGSNRPIDRPLPSLAAETLAGQGWLAFPDHLHPLAGEPGGTALARHRQAPPLACGLVELDEVSMLD